MSSIYNTARSASHGKIKPPRVKETNMFLGGLFPLSKRNSRGGNDSGFHFKVKLCHSHSFELLVDKFQDDSKYGAQTDYFSRFNLIVLHI